MTIITNSEWDIKQFPFKTLHFIILMNLQHTHGPDTPPDRLKIEYYIEIISIRDLMPVHIKMRTIDQKNRWCSIHYSFTLSFVEEDCVHKLFYYTLRGDLLVGWWWYLSSISQKIVIYL